MVVDGTPKDPLNQVLRHGGSAPPPPPPPPPSSLLAALKQPQVRLSPSASPLCNSVCPQLLTEGEY